MRTDKEPLSIRWHTEAFKLALKGLCGVRVAIAASLLFTTSFAVASDIFQIGDVSAQPNSNIDMTTLAGEICSLVSDISNSNDPAVLSKKILRCGDQDVGLVLDVQLMPGLTAASDSERVRKAFEASRNRLVDPDIVACEPAKFSSATSAIALPSTMNGTGAASPMLEVLALPCRNIADGWPQLFLAAIEGERLKVVRGPATAYPALLTLVGRKNEQLSRTEMQSRAQALWSAPVVIGSVADQLSIRSRWKQARLATARLEHVTAERELRQAIEIQSRLFGEADPVTNAILMDLAMIVANQGRVEEAAALLRRVAPVMSQSVRQADRARLTTYQAQIAALRGDLGEALAEAGSAVSQWRVMAEPQVTQNGPAIASDSAVSRPVAIAELAMALNMEAAIILRSGDAASAAVRASEALVTLEGAPDAPAWWRADIMATLGDASGQLGRLSAAEQYLEAARKIRTAIFGEGAGTLRLALALGRAYQREGVTTNAVLAFREAMTQAGRLPRETAPLSDEDLIPFAQTIYDLGETITNAGERQGLYAELFTAFQLTRSADRERVAELTAANLATQSPELASLLRRIGDAGIEEVIARTALAEEQAKAAVDRRALRAEELADKLSQATQTLVGLRQTLSQDYPAYKALVQPLNYALDDVRARLAPDEALAMFIVGQNKSFLQLVKRDGLALAPIDAGFSVLGEAVRQLRRGLEIEGRSVNDFDTTASNDLYKLLFGRAQLSLQGVKRLTIIPASALESLPFGVLIENKVTKGDYRAADWFVRSRAISHSPTLSSFMALRGTRLVQSAPMPFLAIANPVLGGRQTASALISKSFAGCRTADPVDPQILRALSSLPETENEVKSVAKAIGATNAVLLFGANANEAAFRQKKLDDYRIIYFATHGLVPGELQCQNEPGLVLTPPANASPIRAQDGLLDASEIATLSLRADLVVLSACNTAAPQAARLGSGSLSGLAESFFYAGARSVLATHWQVPSAATEQLMSQTFANMGAQPDMAIDEALRQAQLTAIASPGTAHPFFWGAFVVLGDGAGKPLAAGGVGR